MKLKFWIGIGISLLCLYFVFRNTEIEKVLNALRSVNPFYLAIAVLLNLSTIWSRAERWKYLLSPIKRLHFRDLLPITMIGFMANNILPARAGEFVRAYMVGHKHNISKTASLATIVIERVCDMTTMLLFLVLVLIFIKFPETTASNAQKLLSPTFIKHVGVGSSIFVAGLLIFLIILKEFPQQTQKTVRFLLTPFPHALSHKILELLEAFCSGLHVLDTGAHLLFVAFWSLTVWMAGVSAAWCILRSCGTPLPFMGAMFITVVIAFAVALPSSPGYIGPFHAAVAQGVLFFFPHIDQSTVAGHAIVFHLVTVIPIIVMGLYYMWKEQLSLADIKHIEEEEQAEISTDATN